MIFLFYWLYNRIIFNEFRIISRLFSCDFPYESSKSSPQTVRKRLGDTFSALRKRVRPVSDVFVNLKKRSNAKLTKSTENLARGFQFNFLRSATRVQSRESLDESVDSCSKEDIREQIAKIEKEELALREMHDLYR